MSDPKGLALTVRALVASAIAAAAKGHVDEESAAEFGKRAVEYNAAVAAHRNPTPAPSPLPIARALPPRKP